MSSFDLSHFISRVVARLRHRWKGLVAAAALVAAPLIVMVSLSGPTYHAEMVLAAAGSSKFLSGDIGLASSLLSGPMVAGIQSTPAMIVQLTGLDGVLYPVAMSRVKDRGNRRVVDLIARKVVSDTGVYPVTKIIRKHVMASFDRQTGLISLAFEDKDSALARVALSRVMDEATSVFQAASRSQGAQFRQAQTARVDTASRRLAEASVALLDFTRRNRVITPFSEAALEQQRLQREADLANTVYSKAVNDREAAIAKELENTPAVVIVEGPPSLLPAKPRYLALKIALIVIAALGLVAFVYCVPVLRDELRALLAGRGVAAGPGAPRTMHVPESRGRTAV